MIERFGATPCIVIPVRNPLEVAASLKHRDNFLPAKSYLLWLRHVLDAEQATRHLPRAVVAYNDLLGDWRGVVGAVAAKAGLHWARRSDRSELEIDRFVAEALRHHVVNDSQLAAGADIVDWVKETYRLLRDFAKKPAAKDKFKRLDRIHAEFDKACASFGLVLAAEAEQSASQLQSVEALIKTQDEETARLSGELTKLRGAADAAQAASAAGPAQARHSGPTSMRRGLRLKDNALSLPRRLKRKKPPWCKPKRKRPRSSNRPRPCASSSPSARSRRASLRPTSIGRKLSPTIARTKSTSSPPS